MRLLVPAAIALLALSPSIAAAQRIGTTAAVNPQATGEPPGGQSKLLIVGQDVVFEERIVTSDNGQTQLLFLDQSSLTVGPNAEVVLDRFVYNPETSTGELALSITKGVFRFVGGKISANSGATIDTPAATLGIRGSIVYGAANAACADGQAAAAPAGGACLDMVYVAGDQLTAANSGGTVTFQRSGRRITVPSAQQPAEDLGRAAAADISRFVEVLEGAGGGGAPETPTQVVVQQHLGPPPTEAPALPDANLGTDAASAAAARSTVATINESADVGDVRNDTAAEETAQDQPEPPPPPPPPPPPQGNLSGRLLATPDAGFTSDDGGLYASPLEQNVLGGPDPDFSPAISNGLITSTGRFQAETPLGPIDLPFLPGPDGTFTFGPAGTETPFGPIAGIGAGAPDFAAYAGVLANSTAGDRVFIIAGEPTPSGGNLLSPSLQLSTYDVIPDPVYQADVPFIPGHVAEEFDDPTVSELYILRRAASTSVDNGRIADGTSPNRSRFLIGAGAIEGEGASQKSFLLGAEGSLVTTDNGKLSVSIGSQGSFRLDGTEGPMRQSGGLGTISDANADQFFGPNLNFFALTTSGPRLLDSDPDVDVGSAFLQPYALNSNPGEAYSYTHLVTQAEADAPLASRSARVLTGYAAVLGETRFAGDQFAPPYVLTTYDPTAVVAMEPSTNSLFAFFDMEQNFVSSGGANGPNYVSDVNSASFAFGGFGQHVGTYIDDDRYAARNARDSELYGSINGEQGLPSEISPDGFRSIMIAHEVVPMNGFPQNGLLAECACFEWGWWASEFRWADSAGPNQNRRERFHMGTFIVGNVPDPMDVQDIIDQNQVATYGGHIIGNVYNEGAQYIAAGEFSHRVDFGARSGEIAATFDNRSYSGSSSFKSPNVSGFEGHLASTDAGPRIQGLVDGSFVRNGEDPVGGMIGTKRFYDSATNGNTFRASTTFGGKKVPPVNQH